jgi:hypothetical protein
MTYGVPEGPPEEDEAVDPPLEAWRCDDEEQAATTNTLVRAMAAIAALLTVTPRSCLLCP